MRRRAVLYGLSQLPLASKVLSAPPRSQPRAPSTWPKLPAFSANNFLDHFAGSVLDPSKWDAITGHTAPARSDGTITVTDSNVQFNSAAHQGAAMYHVKQLDLSKSQLWTACVYRNAGGGPSNYLAIVNGKSPPKADVSAKVDASTRIYAAIDHQTGPQGFSTVYYDQTHAPVRWDGSGSTWTTASAVDMYHPTRDLDYYVLGIEIDSPNQRVRLMGWCKTYTSGYTFDQGWRLFGLSDWVNWSAMEDTSKLWIIFGNPYTNLPAPSQWRFEWIKYAEATQRNRVMDAWAAAKPNLASSHQIRHYYSFEGQTFVPETRNGWALTFGASGQFDSTEMQEPCGASDGLNTDYIFYTGINDGYVAQIGVAKATHVAPPQRGPWTKGARNPVIPAGAAGAYDDAGCGSACAFKDNTEPDSNKRWKMLYSAFKSSDGLIRTMYATAPDPPDTSTWSKHGLALDVGALGANDCRAARCTAVARYNGLWEVWYEGRDNNNVSHLMRATGTDLGALTKDAKSPYYSPAPGVDQAITADLTGRVVTVENTAGFVPDAMVVFDQDANLDNYGVSRIRKILSPTQIELYHGLDGFTVATPARIKQLDSSPNFSPRWMGQVGSEWWFYLTNWEPFAGSSDGASYGALLEQMVLYKHSAAAPSGAIPVMQFLASPIISRGFNHDQESVENAGVMTLPVDRS